LKCSLLLDLFLLAIMLSVILRFTDYDYSFDIFKLLVLVISVINITDINRKI